MQSPAELHLNELKLCAHSFPDGLAPDDKRPVLVRSCAEMREAEKVESLRLTQPLSHSVIDRPTSKLDQPGFLRVQG